MSQPQPLQVLLVEDSENDALLLELELQRAGYEPVCVRVENGEAMSDALARQRFDLIIADYIMPRFNGLEALALVNSRALDIPFIIVSGHISDDTAVAAMKAGAHDYVMKDNLTRLGSAVQRELREAEVRRQRRAADAQLKVEQVFRQAIENSVPSGITAVDLDGRQTYVNPAFCAMVGWSEQELVGVQPPFAYWPPEQVETITQALSSVIEGHAPASGLELRFRRRTGERIDVLLQITPLKDPFGDITGWVSSVSNITERKRAEARLAAEHAITRLLAHARSLDEAAPGLLQALLDGLEADCGLLWLPQGDPAALRVRAVGLRSESSSMASLAQASREVGFTPGAGLPGRAWQERRAVWITDLSDEEGLPRLDAAVKAGVRSAATFPLQNAGDFFGVLEFYALRRMELDPALANMMHAIGSEVGQFIQRRAAEEALRQAHDQLEVRVQRRTAELKAANAKLEAAIAERRRLEAELLEITERERRRIGLDLHDDLGQKLSGIALMVKGLQLKLAKQHSDGAQDAAKVHKLVQEAMSHASDLAHDLATLDVAKKELPAALDELAARARELFHIQCRFSPEGPIPSLEPNVITQLYKIAQEALTNAIKHGKAKRVGINLANGSDRLVLTVQNSGVPFPDLHSHSTGMGLRIMNYRASLIGASLEVKAAGDKGTQVTCSLPLENKS
ncbi:MAG TPA: PAS domain S-box protein [Verrucomicrobiae bacterium]|nr:PAS domain S-box protein [Verrucomicrobiae bacterium]